MHVDVERHCYSVYWHKLEFIHTRFLARFAQRHVFHAPMAVGMPTQLKPAVQLAVVRQKKATTIGRNNPGSGRDVARAAGPTKTISVLCNEVVDSINDARLDRIGLPVAREHLE
jgi:hypothetical protein